MSKKETRPPPAKRHRSGEKEKRPPKPKMTARLKNRNEMKEEWPGKANTGAARSSTPKL